MWNIFSDGSIHIDCQVSQEMVIDFNMTVKLLPGFLLSDPTGLNLEIHKVFFLIF